MTSQNEISTINIEIPETEHFNCPISTCGNCIPLVPSQIAEHLQSKHKRIAYRMYLTKKSANKAFAFFCKSCQCYNNNLHFICYECKDNEHHNEYYCFTSKQALDEHLKIEHYKWWYEKMCVYGDKCHGISGGCGFNHTETSKPCVTQNELLPEHFCQFERPWYGMRCNRNMCSDTHLWGRVKFLIKSRNIKNDMGAEIVDIKDP
jgi:hypothetical protein